MLLLEVFQGEVRGRTSAETGGGVVAKRQFGECLVIESSGVGQDSAMARSCSS